VAVTWDSGISLTEWARIAISAYHRYSASRIVAETNAGGEMVENTLRQIDPNVVFKEVRASRGKVRRAEPVVSDVLTLLFRV
jgi:phage terminase large subunit-like protein